MITEVNKNALTSANELHIPTGLPGGFFIYEASGDETILFADDNIVRLYGCDSIEDFREYTGNTFKGMVYEEDFMKIENEINAQTMFGEKRHDYVRYRIKTKQGDIRYIEDFGHLLHGQNGKSYFYVFIIDVDLDEYLNRSRNSFAEVQVLSTGNETDSLTGLFNMSIFYLRVQSLMVSPEYRRQEVAFIHFDITNFKLYNERYGFRNGDELLCAVAGILREYFSEGIVARFSDDHFVVCIASRDKEQIISLVDSSIQKVLRMDDSNKRVRLKAGIYFIDDRFAEVGLACDHARLACNSVKGRHDINFCIYDELIREKLRKQQYVIDHIDEAIENDYIKVYYQPVIRVKTGEICGYEALTRWIDPVVGFLSPADFIDTLEQFHLIHKIDSYMIKKVCEDYSILREKGEPLVPVSINLSRLDFELCDIFEVLENAREEYDVPCNMIDIEITESALNDNSDLLRIATQRFNDLGYHVWIDDFGSGYSSLNILAEYTFNVLKLDLIFLKSMENTPRTGDILTYIISAARAMGIEPLTEGVETEKHFNFLKEVNCECAQGYYFGKPQPMDESREATCKKGLVWEKVDPEKVR